MKKIISLLIVAFLGLGAFAVANADAYNSWNNGWNNNNWNNWSSADSASCKTYYDGCNTCTRQYPGGPQVCTKLACFAHGTPYCKDYFNNNYNNNRWNGWGWNPWNNYKNNNHDWDHDNDHDHDWDHH